MTEQDIEIITAIKPYYLQYKKHLTFNPPMEIQTNFNEMHKRLKGRYIEPCGQCWTTALVSILIESGVGLD